ncbi:ATP-binding cassette domain-containing protein [Slackia exigua]|uniref:ATP-binding cassette domain-containing protein n=1 Tax=Slackia exigua TaxID=84109 RepID=UPI002551B985|nr:ATP-binding cassette domain-containing protein [Slackia exigua]MDK7724285.1 ATP-binding cassette domain-containing protein [Slackia exigua]MDK7725613.1 ATP-binding cassette domain-containing protein [Slackia exigua]
MIVEDAALAGGAFGSRAGAGGAEALASTLMPDGSRAEALSPSARADVRFEGLCKAYGSNRVLRDVSFTLAGGSVTCLMAPSGSGKTTLFRVLLGLEDADAGRVSGVELGRIAMMFQEDRLCETLTPVENVALVLPPRTRRAEVRALLEEVLPPECLGQPVMELSGGMRRRVSLARAVAFPCDLMVLDEPFTGLDRATRQRVIDFVLRHRAGRTLLVATHGEEDAELLGATRVNLDDVQDGRLPGPALGFEPQP